MKVLDITRLKSIKKTPNIVRHSSQDEGTEHVTGIEQALITDINITDS